MVDNLSCKLAFVTILHNVTGIRVLAETFATRYWDENEPLRALYRLKAIPSD